MSFEEIWEVLAYDDRKPILRAVQNSFQFSAVHVQIIRFGCHLRKYGTYWHMMTENPFYALCQIVSSFRLFMYKSYIFDVIWGNMGRIGIWWPKTRFTRCAKQSPVFGCSCTNHTFLMSFEEIWDVLAYDDRKPVLRAVQNSLQFSAFYVQIIHFGCHLRKYGTYCHMMTEIPFYALCKIVSSFRPFMYKSYILDVIWGNLGRIGIWWPKSHFTRCAK